MKGLLSGKQRYAQGDQSSIHETIEKGSNSRSGPAKDIGYSAAISKGPKDWEDAD
jgi:hypothetical protein